MTKGIRLGLPTITSAAWHGALQVTGHRNGVVGASNGRPQWRFPCATSVIGLKVNDSTVAFVSQAHQVTVLDNTGQMRWTGDGGPNLDLCGERLALIEQQNVVIRDVNTGEEHDRFPFEGRARTLRWSNDGRAVVLACTDGTVRIYGVPGGVLHLRHQVASGVWDAALFGDSLAIVGQSLHLVGPAPQVVAMPSIGRAVAWSPTGQELVVGTAKSGVHRFDRRGQNGFRVAQARRPVLDVDWGANGIRWATWSRVFDGSTVRVAGSVLRVAAQERGDVVVTSSGVVCFAPDGSRIQELAVDEPVRGASIHPTGRTYLHTARHVACAGKEPFQRAWSVPLPRAVTVGPGPRLVSAYHRSSVAEGRTLELRVEHPTSGVVDRSIVEPTALDVEQLGMGDGWVAARSDERVVVWSTSSGRPLTVIDGVQPTDRGLVVGKGLVSAMQSGHIHYWRPTSEPKQLDTGQVTALAVDPSGTRLAVGIQSARHAAVQTWDLRSGGKICAGLPDVNAPVVAIACSVETRRVAAILRGSSTEIVIWDGLFGQSLAIGRSEIPWSRLSLSEDGNRLVVGSVDGDVWAWRLDTLTEALTVLEPPAS
ncbi:MAG: hypothetical protein AAGA48_13860 [Myxococcota bacterium]